MSLQAQPFGGEHTDVKLDIISQYLRFFTNALSGKFELVYVDPFCGSGFYRTNTDRQEDRQVHIGSALRALGTPNARFDRVLLNDIRPANVKALKQTVETEFPGRRVEYSNLDANDFIQRVCRHESGFDLWRGTRGVIFLDPFATEVSWSSIEAIARTKALDMWILFPRKAISRIAPIRMDESLDNHPHRSILDRVFGDDSWRQMYQDGFKREYERLTQIERAWQPMLGQLADIDPQHSIRGPEAMIAYLYRRRLRSVLPRLSDVRAALYINGQPHFELIFGIANPSVRAGQLATDVANYILENHPSVQIKD